MFNSVRLSKNTLSAFILIAVCFIGSALVQGGKGHKGHPITLDPVSVKISLALNEVVQQKISFSSKQMLHDIKPWVVPEIGSFITVEPGVFDVIEVGEVYEFTISFSVPVDAAPSCFDGTIHFRDGNRTLAKPLPVSIEVRDEFIPESNWPYRRYDLEGTACNPNGTTFYAGDYLLSKFSIPGADYYVLTGDVDGDGEIEIITTSGSSLNIYSGDGSLENSIELPRPCQLSMLEDADGDGVLDIGLGGRGDGFTGYIYRADGTLLKSLAGEHGGWYGDHSMTLLTISDGKVLVGYNAGYSRTPRGVASFDYLTGVEEWYYQIGPANGLYSLADMDGDGALDITMNSATVHNGASGNGTTDGDLYLVVVDEYGSKKISLKYPAPSNGNVRHVFQDMDGNGSMEILAFEGHDPRYYPGQSQIHIYDDQGYITHTFNGPNNSVWDYAIGDLDNDGVNEVVASARNAQTLYILDNQLQLAGEANVVGNVKLICDLTGDGYKEIVLLDNDGWLTILDLSLSAIAEVKCGSKSGNVIVSDIDGDGIVEVLVQTDQLYVYSFGEEPRFAPVWVEDPIMGGDALVDTLYSGTLAGKAADPNGDPVSYSRDPSGPAWLTVAADGTLSGTPTTAGTHWFDVIASDIDGATHATLGIVVKEPAPTYVRVADSLSDFSSVQGENGWYYGYSAGSGFISLVFSGSKWTISSKYWTQIHATGSHPNSTTTSFGRLPVDHSTIRRWVCPETGDYQIRGSLWDIHVEMAYGDGVEITVAGQHFNVPEGGSVPVLIDTTLNTGDFVDIIVSPKGNDFADDTGTAIEIYKRVD